MSRYLTLLFIRGFACGALFVIVSIVIADLICYVEKRIAQRRKNKRL